MEGLVKIGRKPLHIGMVLPIVSCHLADSAVLC